MILEEIIRKQKQEIERLEKETKQLKEKIDSVKESYETDAEAKYYDYVGKRESKLQKRIDKAIEYINHENFKRTILVGVGTKKYTRNILDNILNILKGSDKNEYK